MNILDKDIVFTNKIFESINNNKPQEIIDLIKKNPDISISLKNSAGETPLHYAVRLYRTDLVTLLIKKGASLTEKDSNEDTPLQTAIYVGWMEGVKLLLRRETVNIPNSVGNRPLHSAIANHAFDVIKPILNAGADINAQNMYGNTALHFAANRSYVFKMFDVIKLLLKRGANIHATNRNGEIPFDFAVNHKNRRTIKLLSLYGNLAQCKKRVSSRPKDGKRRRRTLKLQNNSSHSQLKF